MTQPRVLRPVPDPLGSYLRPTGRDHKVLLQMLVEGKSIGTGVVADPCLASRQHELLDEARRRGVETVLDPRTVDLSTVGGFVKSHIQDLPWADERPHTPQALAGGQGALMVRHIVTHIEEGKFSAVLAPTHVVGSSQDPWLNVDLDLTQQLRRELDSRGLRDVLIYYPLVLKAPTLNAPDHQHRLLAALSQLRGVIDAIWLRVHPFGTTTSGPLALRRYMEACRALHALGLPLVAEHAGAIGVALLAFGAVGGTESGITFTDRVNLDSVLRPPKPGSSGFLPPPRSYLHEIASFLTTEQATAFFERKGMKSAHGCNDGNCCPRGWRDTLLDPRPHFVNRRSREVAALSAVPQSLRAGHYMENFLRPATDKALRAAQLEPALDTSRKRLESWRGTLGAQLTLQSQFTVSPPAAGRKRRSA